MSTVCYSPPDQGDSPGLCFMLDRQACVTQHQVTHSGSVKVQLAQDSQARISSDTVNCTSPDHHSMCELPAYMTWHPYKNTTPPFEHTRLSQVVRHSDIHEAFFMAKLSVWLPCIMIYCMMDCVTLHNYATILTRSLYLLLRPIQLGSRHSQESATHHGFRPGF